MSVYLKDEAKLSASQLKGATLNDNGTDTSSIWSANKTNIELGKKANAGGSLSTNFQANQLTVNKILPNGANVDIGSPTSRFKNIYVDEAHLSANTLYIDGVPVIGSSNDTIDIKADPNQGIMVRTTGLGATKIASENTVLLTTSGMNADVNLTATGSGSKVNVSASSQAVFTAPDIFMDAETTVKKNLTVNGNLTVKGTQTVLDTQTLAVKDNIIEVNKGQTGQGVSAGTAGLSVNRGDAPAYLMVFDETDDLFKVGMSGQLETIASRPWSTTELNKRALATDLTSHTGNTTSHITSTERNSWNAKASGTGVSGIWKVGHTFYNVCNLIVRETPSEMLIKTKIKWLSSNHMPTVHIKGYAYGQQSPIELKLGWYIYDNKIGYCGVVSMGSWRPTVKLFSYTDNNVKYVGIALIGDIYYPQFTIDLYDAWGNDYSAGWTTAHKLKTDTGASIIPTTDLLTVPYKSTFSASINGVAFNGTSNITITADPNNHASSKVTTLSGYTKPASASAITTSDSLNTALGKLEKGVEGKLGSSSNAVSASKWATARTLSLTGDVTGSVSIDGSSNVSITTVVGDNSHNHTNYVPTSDVVTTATANKILKLDANSKLPASITGDAHSVDGKHVDDTKTGSDTTTNNALWTANKIKTQLDGKANSSHGTHVTYATVTSSLTSGGTGVVGSSSKLAREDHTHTLPAYPTSLPANGGNADTVDGFHATDLIKSTITNTGDTAGRWTATIPNITSLYDGLTIRLRLAVSYNSSYNLLNLNGLGDKLVWYRRNERLTSHVPQYAEICLTYRTDAGSYTSGSTTWTDGWILQTVYQDGNTWNSMYFSENINIGEKIYGYDLLMKATDDKWYPLVIKTGNTATSTSTGNTTKDFLVGGDILWYSSDSDLNAGNVASSNIRATMASNVANPLFGTFTQYKDVYIVGTVVNGKFKIDSSNYWTHSLPTTDNGKVYMYLGYMSTTTTMRLSIQHPLYWFKNGSIQLYTGDHNHDATYLGKTATASAATKLATARTINGVSFDGTTNINIVDSGKVSPTGTIVADRIATFKDTTGKVIKDSGFTIAKSVPSNAVFTDTQRALATTTTSLSSGATGAVGTSSSVARADHTHTLPAYPTSLPANGGNSDTVDGKHVNDSATDANNLWTASKIRTELDNRISSVVTSLDWKESVNTFNDIATTYPKPEDGWTVNVKDTDITYRYSGTSWIAISANAIPAVSTTVNGLMTKEDKVKLNGIATGANNYVHPTTDGNKHIPAAGAANQWLKYSAAGTAVWSALPTSSTSATGIVQLNDATNSTSTTTAATANAVKKAYDLANGKASTAVVTTSANGLMSTGDKTKLDGIATGANNYVHPTTDGNKHIPSGGAANQWVKWSSAGTGSWSALPSASTSASGIVQLNDATNNTSTTQAATANAVKKTYDLANHSHPYVHSTNDVSTTATANKVVKRDANGSIEAKSVKLDSSKSEIKYNATDECVEFIFSGTATTTLELPETLEEPMVQ